MDFFFFLGKSDKIQSISFTFENFLFCMIHICQRLVSKTNYSLPLQVEPWISFIYLFFWVNSKSNKIQSISLLLKMFSFVLSTLARDWSPRRIFLYRYRWNHEFLNWRAKIKGSYFIHICESWPTDQCNNEF